MLLLLIFAKVFEEFDPVPIESASLAQVHVARTHDGKKLLKFYSLLFLPQSSFSMLSRVQVSMQIMHKYRTRMFPNCFLCQNYFLNIQVHYTHMTDTAAADHATVELIVNTLNKFFPSFDYRWLLDEMRESLPKERIGLFTTIVKVWG
ncbi:putative ABC1 protein At2g40090 [Pistacia vera]|uniref:putative ABC1 protein At2g40090 n=1 Tax=Pistacia vera TaxID=55513 RepID=UPI00126349A9|nr:putative ABC1 protein At2g40090 [Pistacia vera]XP_031256502.1 putative ABC1 protein At2g40090 [Pistacia vera]XP_031256503.1 putative ABC1 protein At2g40090 [Pistacia vera]